MGSQSLAESSAVILLPRTHDPGLQLTSARRAEVNWAANVPSL